jgi:hypothetical protein
MEYQTIINERHDTVARASLAAPFDGLPSRCSSCVSWLHITDFDRQTSSGNTRIGKGEE